MLWLRYVSFLVFHAQDLRSRGESDTGSALADVLIETREYFQTTTRADKTRKHSQVYMQATLQLILDIFRQPKKQSHPAIRIRPSNSQ